MERIKTGISGLDELLNGGIPATSQVFVCGGPGTGKSTLGVEFLYRGAKMGEKGLFFTLEEDPESIIRMVDAVFPEWKDFKGMIDSGSVIVTGSDSYIHFEKAVAPGTGMSTQYAFSRVLGAIQGLVTDNGIKRVVIDSSTILKMFFGEGLEFRRTLMALLRNLKKAGCTTIITAEITSLERGAFAFESEHFVADGLIMLYNLPQQEKRLSAIEVLKMRKTAHSRSLTPLKITPGGISIYVGEKVY
jgi:KaiC/GvpD/RAD55 family RecA-like ATPase